MTVIAAPPALPCSASKLLVLTFTVSIVSAGETSIVWCGSQMFTLVAPSVLVPLLLRSRPLTLVRQRATRRVHFAVLHGAPASRPAPG